MYNTTIIELIQGYRSISIIGMDKNVGKTTVLNHLIQNAKRDNLPLGITSIGRDGEELDLVTSTKKPRIYVRKDTIIATAKDCIKNCDITKEVLQTTGIHTALGEVIILKALSDGYVDLGGPSVNSHMSKIVKELSYSGCNLVLVDGALSRKTFASPSITEATILSTGASLSKDMDMVVEKTKHSVNLLSSAEVKDNKLIELCKSTLEEQRINIIYKDYTIKSLNNVTSLNSSKDIIENINDKVSYIYLKGILSDKLLKDFINTTNKYKNITFIAEDGTKLFLEKETLDIFKAKGGNIQVISPINLLCLTCNPKSPFSYEFNKHELLNKLQSSIELPVYDILQ